MAFRLQWHAAGNVSFLRESWPLINASAAFWASRLVRHASGNFTVLGVVGPDEPAGVVDHDVYTNAVASQTIRFAADAAAVLKHQELPAEWLTKAAAPFLPLSTRLADSNGAHVHPEYAAYTGGRSDCCVTGPGPGKDKCCVEQSATGLLQYPLGLPMPEAIKRNDLSYCKMAPLARFVALAVSLS